AAAMARASRVIDTLMRRVTAPAPCALHAPAERCAAPTPRAKTSRTGTATPNARSRGGPWWSGRARRSRGRGLAGRSSGNLQCSQGVVDTAHDRASAVELAWREVGQVAADGEGLRLGRPRRHPEGDEALRG